MAILVWLAATDFYTISPSDLVIVLGYSLKLRSKCHRKIHCMREGLGVVM